MRSVANWRLAATSVLAAFLIALAGCIQSVHAAEPKPVPKLTLDHGDHVCLIGNTLAERLQYFGHFETCLHLSFPASELVVRNLGFSADEVKFRPRSMNFGTPDQHLTMQKADVILAFFGFNESFAGDEGLPAFEADLREFVQHTLEQKYNGRSAPRLALISPIMHEDLKNPHLPDGKASSAHLAKYCDVMRKVAKETMVPFVDLITATRDLMEQSQVRLTLNGIHLTDDGERIVAPVLVERLFGLAPKFEKEAYEKLRAEVNEKNYQFFHRYRAVNGYYIYGERNRVWNNEAVMENERGKLDDMTAIRDKRVWAIAQGHAVPATIDDSGTRPHLEVKSNFNEPIRIVPPEDAVTKFTLAKGYRVNLFASEVEFPDLKNPVQTAFDARGRLWVSTMPSYPGYLPPEKPDDKLLILEDTDGDGKADKQTVFADKLHVPTGFEFGEGGVYLAQQPNLMFLKDTDGDDKADVRQLILHGFDTGDTHHAMHAFTWGPGGGLFFAEGTFHHTAVETPYGPVRNAHGGIYRFDPVTWKFETWVHYNFANPWGIYFDKWGQSYVADASGGANYYGTAFSGKAPQFTGQPDFGPFLYKYRDAMQQFFPMRLRPTCGCELVSSRQFPPDAQGNYLLNNVIGFQGVLQHTVAEKDSGFIGKEIEPLLQSSDRNFRPTALKFGPDGALYIVDWYNPLIGHLQHSIRDPNRDHTHGRVWRVTYADRPLVKAPQIVGESIEALLELLRTYEDRTRYNVRRELRDRPAIQVMAALDKWIASLDPNDRDHEHLLVEALWMKQHHDIVDEALLKRVLRSPDYHARAAATNVLAYWRDRVSDAQGLLVTQIADEHPRVRLEALRACSFVEDQWAAEMALEALKLPTDYYIMYTLKQTMRALEPYWKSAIVSGKPFAADNPRGTEYILASLGNEDLVAMARSQPVYEALLTRHGIAEQFRSEALAGLAKLNSSTPMAELLAVIGRLDRSPGDHGEHVLSDLAQVLAAQTMDQIASVRDKIETLARSGRLSMTRRAAYVALFTHDRTPEKIWTVAIQSPAALVDAVAAVPLIHDAQIRSALYSRIEPLLHGLPKSLAEKVRKFKGIPGRFVRIELPGQGRVLTLAEVEVASHGNNVARGGHASQSSVAYNGSAERAIDGNTSGRYGDNGQTHTNAENNPWWEVDLQQEVPIESITVWNRTDDDAHSRLDGFTLQVLDASRKPVFTRKAVPAPHEKVSLTVVADAVEMVRTTAINAVTFIPDHEAETFGTLAGFVKNNISRGAALRGLGRIPRSKAPIAQVQPLVDTLIKWIESVPAVERTQTEVIEAIRLGKDLALALPAPEGRSRLARLRELGVDVFIVRPLPHKMQYDRTLLYVEVGKPYEIVFDNTDIMPHNLVVTAPGAREAVGILAEKLGATPEGAIRQFVPDSPRVLAATNMLQTGQQQRLKLTAPAEPGEYPFVCTFPGHWRTMFGTIRVVKDISEIPLETEAAPVNPAAAQLRPFVRKWQVADLAGSLNQLDAPRSAVRGKQLFQTLACATCHQLRGEGGKIGPDLTEVSKKLATKKMDRLGLITELLQPSKAIDEKFRTQVITTDDGKFFSGVIVFEDDKLIRLVTNPLENEAQPQEIRKDAIDERTASNVSIMPEGLLNTLTREEILDLLAFVVKGDGGHQH